MGISLRLVTSEGNIDREKNTSSVTAKLYVTAKGSTEPFGHGHINIAGTTYSFSNLHVATNAIPVAIRSKAITHNADGSRKIAVSANYISLDGTSKSIAKSITLTTIKRIFTITLNNNGTISTKTKNYNVNLTLPIPTRTGYTFGGWYTEPNGKGTRCSGASGNIYSSNSAATLYAKWTIDTYSVKLNAEGGNVSQTSLTKTYNVSLTLPIPTRTGYSFGGWYTGKNGTGTLYNSPYTQNSSIILYAYWTPRTFTASFNINGGTGDTPTDITVTYNTNFIFPSNENFERTDYDFLGWSTSSNDTTAKYFPGESNSIIWTLAQNTTFYAIWKGTKLSVNYYEVPYNTNNNFNNPNTYIIHSTSIVSKFSEDYRIENILLPSLNNYTFTGLWTLDKPNQKIYTEYGVSFPAGIVPYNYDVIANADNYLKSGNIIPRIEDNVNIYPIYKDNRISSVSFLYSSYEYVPDSVKENDYFNFLTGRTSRLSTNVSSEYVVMLAKFRTSSEMKDVSLDISTITGNLRSFGENIPVVLNSVFFRSVYNEELNNYDLYVIYRNQDPLPSYETTEYIFTLSNIKDSFGKPLNNVEITIFPPKIVRDVNSNGDSVAFFTDAPDYTITEKETTHLDNELWNNGLLISHNYLMDNSTFEESLSSYISNLSNIKTIDKIDLEKLLLYIIQRL